MKDATNLTLITYLRIKGISDKSKLFTEVCYFFHFNTFKKF